MARFFTQSRIIVLSLIAFICSGAFGNEYPVRPIRIVTSLAGGTSNDTARLIAQEITGPLGQPVIVENRPSIISIEMVAKATPDGYSVLISPSAVWIDPLLRNTHWDPIRDFAPVVLATTSPSLIVINPSVPVNSVKELIALARSRPGQLNYGSSGSGTSTHLAGELFKAMAGVNIVRVPYKGSGQYITALLSGEVQLTFSSAGSVAPYLKSGRLKALAVASAQPTPLAPELPTITASGFPGFVSANFTGVFVPAKTPAEIVKRLNQEFVRFLARPDTKDKLLNSGLEAVGGTPRDFAVIIKSEITKMGKVIKDADISVR